MGKPDAMESNIYYVVSGYNRGSKRLDERRLVLLDCRRKRKTDTETRSKNRRNRTADKQIGGYGGA